MRSLAIPGEVLSIVDIVESVNGVQEHALTGDDAAAPR